MLLERARASSARAPGFAPSRQRSRPPTTTPSSRPPTSPCPALARRTGRSGEGRRRSSRPRPRGGRRRSRSRRRRPQRATVDEPASPPAALDVRVRRTARPSRRQLRRPSDLDRRPQPRRGGAGVGGELARTRAERAASQLSDDRFVTTGADREVRRADAPARLVAQEPLNDPILERVKADDGEASAATQHPHGVRQCGLEEPELVVDGDAECLEHPLRRIAVAEARGSRYRALDDVDQFPRPRDRAVAARTANLARDPARVTLLSVAAEDRRQLAL